MRSFFLHMERATKTNSATVEVTAIFARNGAVVRSRSARYRVSATNRSNGWARMKRRLVYAIWRWYCSKTSIPKGAATDWKRAATTNCRPIKDRPTKPNATEKLMRNPLPGSIPEQARTSGAMVTARYTRTRNIARTARPTALRRLSRALGERGAVLFRALPVRSCSFRDSTRGSASFPRLPPKRALSNLLTADAICVPIVATAPIKTYDQDRALHRPTPKPGNTIYTYA